jgi:hypothetical protein
MFDSSGLLDGVGPLSPSQDINNKHREIKIVGKTNFFSIGPPTSLFVSHSKIFSCVK